MNVQNVKVNLLPGGIPPIVHLSQYDNGRPIQFTLYDGSEAATIATDTSIYLEGTKPDGNGFQLPCNYTGNIITVKSTTQMAAVYGDTEAELVLRLNNNVVGTANLIIKVEKAALADETLISDSDMPVFREIAETLEKVGTLATDFSGASSTAAGAHGLVPAPAAGQEDYVLTGDGKWSALASATDFYGASATDAGTHGLVPAPAAGDDDKFLSGDGSWKDINTSVMTGATSSAAGKSGLVPTPAKGDQDKYLSGDGTWKEIDATAMEGATSSTAGKGGVVPAPAAGDNSKVLTGDAKWTQMLASMVNATDTNGALGTAKATVTMQALIDAITDKIINKVVNNLTTTAAGYLLDARAGNSLMTGVYGTSDTYDSSKTYAVSDLCIYDAKLWKCLVAATGVTPTEGTTWTQVSLSNVESGGSGDLILQSGTIDYTAKNGTSTTYDVTFDQEFADTNYLCFCRPTAAYSIYWYVSFIIDDRSSIGTKKTTGMRIFCATGYSSTLTGTAIWFALGKKK